MPREAGATLLYMARRYPPARFKYLELEPLLVRNKIEFENDSMNNLQYQFPWSPTAYRRSREDAKLLVNSNATSMISEQNK